MCSWCWGFKPVLKDLESRLSDNIQIEYILGGLAADNDTPMSEDMKLQIQAAWKRIEETIPGTQFNYDFWKNCIPKRSTYLSCRAVIAARKQCDSKSFEMITAIQEAYYLKALNPSDLSVLKKLAADIGLNVDMFSKDIVSPDINKSFEDEISFSRKIGADSFPSLYLYVDKNYYPIVIDYNHSDVIIDHLNSFK